MTIKTNLDRIRSRIRETAAGCGRTPEAIRLIGVSKRKPAALMEQAIDAGHLDFGENYIQEACEKIDIIGKDRACWHFIGHLQSNKAKFAVRYFDYIHTVDKLKLAKEIHKQAAKLGKVQNVLVQINIADETTKSGTQADAALDLVRQISELDHLSVQGLMCMPPFFDDPELARPYFRQLRNISQNIAAAGLANVSMSHLSMGMSNDFTVAIEEGATMVRVGTAIFGSRE